MAFSEEKQRAVSPKSNLKVLNIQNKLVYDFRRWIIDFEVRLS